MGAAHPLWNVCSACTKAHSHQCSHQYQGRCSCWLALQSVDLGELAEIEIGHDNSGMGPGWHLEQVVVVAEASGRRWVFPCDRWGGVRKSMGKGGSGGRGNVAACSGARKKQSGGWYCAS